jgi:phosphate acetyltransferase
MDSLKEMYLSAGIDQDVYDFCDRIQKGLKDRFEKIDQTAEYNQMKVIRAMEKQRVSAECFESSTGYGYDDLGREKLEAVYADVFGTEAALVRPQITCGTHALTLALSAILRPGDELLTPVGKPYDTLEGVIGIKDDNPPGSLKEFGISYRQVDLLEDGEFDLEGIKEALNEKMMQAAFEAGNEGYIYPILVGNKAEIEQAIQERGYDLSVFTVVDMEDEEYRKTLIEKYIALPDTRLKEKALNRRMQDKLQFAMVMQAVGDADVTFAGIDYTTGDVLLAGQMIIGLKPGIATISSIGLCDIPGFEGSEGSLLAVGDSAVCTNPNAQQLASIAISACDTVKSLLDWQPRCACVSYSTLGSGQGELIDKVTEAVKIANELRPDLAIDGEFQLDAAISPSVAAKKVKRESKVAGKANVVIWPDLNVGNVAVKLIQQFGHADAYGPMLQGFKKVVCDCSRGAPVSELKGNIVISAVRAAGEK